MNIREFYLATYPTDELGLELNPNTTINGLLRAIVTNADVYEYIGVSDSLVRERLFEKLAEEFELDYNDIYDMWLESSLQNVNFTV
jgi:hypothetical protein